MAANTTAVITARETWLTACGLGMHAKPPTVSRSNAAACEAPEFSSAPAPPSSALTQHYGWRGSVQGSSD
ncbi:hypothetical protein IG631_10868 [Alternaria alternata]|nr:hypothetical protein IG631_10868 [Alternaria alternata]